MEMYLLIFIILILLFFVSRNVSKTEYWTQTRDWSKHSPKTDAGHEQGIEFLDRHPVDCSRKGIKGFDVNQVDTYKQRFDYDCAGGEESDDFWIKTNEGDECSYLSCYPNSFPVDCGHYPLTYFQYQRNGSGKNNHKFKCGKKATTGNCRNISNSFTEEHKNHTEWLSKQSALECNNNEVLTRVDYEYSNGTGRYKGRCCIK
tara:strand:+ start:1447 stop:2052 length:606 start_codon:yes stop_codon:yes gene_type:complete